MTHAHGGCQGRPVFVSFLWRVNFVCATPPLTSPSWGWAPPPRCRGDSTGWWGWRRRPPSCRPRAAASAPERAAGSGGIKWVVGGFGLVAISLFEFQEWSKNSRRDSNLLNAVGLDELLEDGTQWLVLSLQLCKFLLQDGHPALCLLTDTQRSDRKDLLTTKRVTSNVRVRIKLSIRQYKHYC